MCNSFFFLNPEERHQEMQKYFSGANALYCEEIKFLLGKVPIQLEQMFTVVSTKYPSNFSLSTE